MEQAMNVKTDTNLALAVMVGDWLRKRMQGGQG